MKQSKVFFSYARENSEFVLNLSKDLRATKVNLWLDQLDIPAGARWDQSIQKALTNCKSLIIVLSPDSVNSQNVMDEVSFAIEEEKQIIPILHKDCEIPFRWRRFQYIDFTTDYSDGLAQLLQTLKNKTTEILPEPIETHKNSNSSINENQEHSINPAEEDQNKQPKKSSFTLKFFMIILIASISVAVWKYEKILHSLGITSQSNLHTTRIKQQVLLTTDPKSYHLGDEKIKNWPKKHGRCYETNFPSKSIVKKLVLKLEIFGLENSAVYLNKKRITFIPAQAIRVGNSRPNYWSNKISVILPTDSLKLGTNKLGICSELVENPEFIGDRDDLQIRNIQLIAYF